MDGRQTAWLGQLGLVPVFRYRLDGPWSKWFGEIGVGLTLTSTAYETQRRRFSTTFNFGDHVAVGRSFGDSDQHELALRVQHFSNAGIREPNSGVNFVQLRYSYRFRCTRFERSDRRCGRLARLAPVFFRLDTPRSGAHAGEEEKPTDDGDVFREEQLLNELLFHRDIPEVVKHQARGQCEQGERERGPTCLEAGDECQRCHDLEQTDSDCERGAVRQASTGHVSRGGNGRHELARG